MKSLMTVMSCILHDMGDVCGVSTTRDLRTIACRVEEEGESFLTITLPSYAKSLERSLADGFIAPTSFAGFKRRGGLPCFCRGFLELIFTRSGVLLDNPDVDAIRAVRQISLVFAKIQRECTEDRTARAIAQYVKCEKDMKELELPPLDDLKKVFLVLFGGMMHRVSRNIESACLIPRHGPGATADRLLGNQKWSQTTWTSRLERSFPMDSYLIPNHRYWQSLGRVHVLEPGSETPVRVVTVPKTLKTPRVIAIEPACVQYAQQALLSAITHEVRDDSLLSRSLGLDDQTPNRDLARSSSRDGFHATLDLKEASDRVSNQLVFELTRPYSSFRKALQDARSKTADVPGFGVLRLAKFASMGSAVCFPVEGMVFLAISVLGIIRQRALPLTARVIQRSCKQVRVFGDDIIVPSDSALRVIATLESYGLVVNSDKSFWTGKFRESCGGDFYDGIDVSIHRFRQEIPVTRSDAGGVSALFSFRNKCYRSGYWRTARLLDTHLESLRIPLPRVLSTSPVLGRESFLGYDVERFDSHLHSPLVRGLKVHSRPPVSSLSGPAALLKIFSLRRNEPLREGHLEHQGRPKLVRTKLGWGTPF